MSCSREREREREEEEEKKNMSIIHLVVVVVVVVVVSSPLFFFVADAVNVVDLSQPFDNAGGYNRNELFCVLNNSMSLSSMTTTSSSEEVVEEDNAGSSTASYITGYIVLQRGQVVAEGYNNNNAAAATTGEMMLHPAFSVTKSWASMIIGLLVDSGRLDLNTTLGDIFPPSVWGVRDEDEETNNDDIDNNNDTNDTTFVVVDSIDKQTLTVHEILTMSSGLTETTTDVFDLTQIPTQGTVFDVLNATTYDESDRGTFEYLPSNHILARIIEYVSDGQTLKDVAADVLNVGLGLTDGIDYVWDTFGGIEGSAYGLNTNPRTLAKLGQLYLQQGMTMVSSTSGGSGSDNGGSSSSSSEGDDANAKEILLSSEWVKWSTTNQLQPGQVPGDVAAIFPGYGYQWYTDGRSVGGGSFAAIGAGGQLIFVDPNTETVMTVMTTGFETPQALVAASIEAFQLVFLALDNLDGITKDGSCVSADTTDIPNSDGEATTSTDSPSTPKPQTEDANTDDASDNNLIDDDDGDESAAAIHLLRKWPMISMALLMVHVMVYSNLGLGW